MKQNLNVIEVEDMLGSSLFFNDDEFEGISQ